MSALVPTLIVALVVFALFKRVNVYNAFVDGAKQSVPLCVNIIPYIVAMFLLVNLLQASGVGDFVVKYLAIPFGYLGIPPQLVQLMILRPFSGSGSLAILSDVLQQYGADSYVGRAASVIMGSSETVFYISAVYFSQTKVKKLGWAIPIALFCNLLGGVVACLLCRVM